MREPRATCATAFYEALYSTSLNVADAVLKGDPGNGQAWAMSLSDRVRAVGAALVAINGLPYDVLGACRLKAFKGAVKALMEEYADDNEVFVQGDRE